MHIKMLDKFNKIMSLSSKTELSHKIQQIQTEKILARPPVCFLPNF